MNHPSELKLERHLLDPEASEIAAHVRECERCRERVAQMRQQGDDFRRFVYPATLDQVTRPRAWLRSRALWLLAPAAGLATVLLLVRPGPTSDYVGTKGGPLTLTAYAASPSGTRALEDGAAVSASASLRFRVRTSEPCNLTLLSVDDSGQISKLYSREVRGEITLPGGVQLDGKPGRERFFAVCTDDPGAVEQAARRIGSEVGKIVALPGVQGPQASLLIEKRP
jgi:anti-sigma factor RsiW